MWARLRTLWTVPDLRNKILFTLGMLLVFRILAALPVPLTAQEQRSLFELFHRNTDQNLGQLLGLLDVFSGGSLQTFSIVALGVYPYITATIVMQLLQPIVPALEQLSTQGEAGRKRLSQITRLIAVPLAFLQALGQAAIFQKAGVLQHFSLVDPAYALQSFTMVLTLTAGTMILVWFGELITEKGIGNGISIIIFAGIVSRLPSFIQQGYTATASGGGSGVVSIAVFLIIGVLTIVGVICIYQGQRRVPVQYPTKRMVGRDLQVGSAQTTYIPLQVNSAGMIPLIFAQSMVLFPTLISQYLVTSTTSWLKASAIWMSTYILNTTFWWYWLMYGGLVIAFTYFYAYVTWQQQKLPETLQKQGAFIPGYRPGEPTNRYLSHILTRITLAGALFLGVVAVLPYVSHVGGNQVLSSASLLIVVGVVLDTIRQLEAQMVMRNYSGFLS
jgi:preprotein translocase subunit SecY